MGIPIKELSIDAFQDLIAKAHLPKFRAMQVLEWVYGKNASSYDEMTNVPKQMREQLVQSFPLRSPEVVNESISSDGTVKFLLRYADGALAETVGIPAEDERLTVCVSSQAGCAMKCIFCATGKAGLTRSLYPGEIVDQCRIVGDYYGKRVTNVVMMGQGEPFANYHNSIAALRILNHPKLFNIGARHIALSTCGLVNGIERFSQEPEQFTLAVSLHSANQKTRDELMPSMKSCRLGDLRKSIESYTALTGRRVTFEYALMDGLNDSQEELDNLISFCKRLLCHVNLIPLNHIEGSPIKPSAPKTIERWNETLQSAGITSSIRRSRGSDIAAACGQLASRFGK